MMSKKFGMVALLGALVVTGIGSQVTAQSDLQIGGQRANFGRRPVNPGFVPDPISVNIGSRGNIDARALGLARRRLRTRQPDFIINLAPPSSFLRLYVTGRAATPPARQHRQRPVALQRRLLRRHQPHRGRCPGNAAPVDPNVWVSWSPGRCAGPRPAPHHRAPEQSPLIAPPALRGD